MTNQAIIKPHYNQQNIFAKILRGDLPCTKIYENDKILIFKDINPVAPIHFLAIPKGQYCNFSDFVASVNHDEVAGFFIAIKNIANQYAPKGFRLITNNGSDATQTVEHFHIHIIAGKKVDKLISD